jgi:hypothetical protein
MNTPPPFPPGPGLEWVPLEEFVDTQVEAALAWLDGVIATEPDLDFHAHLVSHQPWLAARVEQIVRCHYAVGQPN